MNHTNDTTNDDVLTTLAHMHPTLQALLGGLFTWGVTALGAAGVFGFVNPKNFKLLDFCLGLAAGVMTAASFWSLLAPAIETAENQVYGRWAWAPVSIGLLLGAGFVFGADKESSPVQLVFVVLF